MRNLELKLKTCTVTMGTPFDETRKKMCPVYEKLRDYFTSRGWEKKHYHAENVHHGGMCIFRYEGLEKPEGGSGEILYSVEVTIRGTETTCTVNMSVNSLDPKNRMRSLNHESEAEILGTLAGILGKPGARAV